MTAPIIFMAVLVIITIVGMLVSIRIRDTAWKQLASDLGAEFIEGGFFRPSKVQAHIQKWIVTLDTYSVSSGDSNDTYTRMKAPFQNKDEFQFTIFRTGLVSKLDKALGAQDIEIGDSEFDRAFTIQSNNELKVRSLFTNQRIRQLIQGQRSIRLMTKGSELYFEAQGVIKDIERLKSLFELFRETLQQLEG